jgi:hypothetical protein
MDYLDRYLIDFVQQVDAGDVGPVAFDDVDKIVGCGVVPQRDVGVVNLVLGQDRFDLIQKVQRNK